LEMLRKQHLPLAIVIDEYGSIKGLVTTGDLLAAIAGELADTHDEPQVTTDQEGWIFDASIALEDLEEKLGIKLDKGENDYFTLAGLLLEQLQHIPVIGEEIHLGGFKFRILEMEGRRIHQVRVIRDEKDSGNTQIGY
jgi:CBS domain containing-hemolysin-like protein